MNSVSQCLHMYRLYFGGRGKRADIATFWAVLMYCVANWGLVFPIAVACSNSVSTRLLAICFTLNALGEPFTSNQPIITVYMVQNIMFLLLTSDIRTCIQ